MVYGDDDLYHMEVAVPSGFCMYEFGGVACGSGELFKYKAPGGRSRLALCFCSTELAINKYT